MIKKLLFPGIAVLGILVTTGLYLKKESIYQERIAKVQTSEEPNPMDWARIDLRTGTMNPAARIEVQNLLRHSASRGGGLDMTFFMRGPDNVGGRTRAIIELFGKPETLIAGSVSGGLFISNNAGGTWQAHEQFQNMDSSSSIIASIHQDTNTGTIYVGTGSSFDEFGNVAGVRWPGYGMYVSTDEGATFKHLTSTTPAERYTTAGDSWLAINRIVTGANGDIYAATERGLQVSRDAGETWENPVYVDPNQTIPQLGICADVSIGKNGAVLVTYYNGSTYLSATGADKSFVNLNSNGIPPGSVSRTVCAIAPSNPDVMYVMLINSQSCLGGIYKSTNGGQSFSKILEPHDAFTPMSGGSNCQGVYDAALHVSATDPNTIYIGGVELWRFDGSLTRIATEGGAPPFQDVLDNYVHADKHYFYTSPNNKKRMYVTSDGGLAYTENRGNTWQGINKGYITTQFYGIAHFSGGGVVMGGTQDNGTLVVLGENANDPNMGYSVFGNDGIDCDASQLMPIAFATSQNGLVVRTDLSAGTSSQPPFSLFSTMGSGGPFNTVIKLWENSKDLSSRDSIIFSVEPTEFAIATGNGIMRNFNESFTPVQPAAKVIESSIIVSSSGMTLTIDPSNPGVLIGDGEGTVTFNNDRSIDVSVNFDQAPSENANILVNYEERYDANDVLIIESENLRSLQGAYTFEHRLENALNPGDIIKIQDPVQSILLSTGDGTPAAGGSLRLYRNVLNAQLLPPSPLAIAGISGTITCIEISNDGDVAFVGTSGGTVYRLSGLKMVYTQDDVDAIEFQPLPNIGGPVTGIAIDRTNNNRIVVTGGGYGLTNRVRYSANALDASPTYDNVHGNLAPMPIYDAEFNVNDPNMVLIGTEFGLWGTTDITAGTLTEWNNENHPLSYLPVYDIRQQWLPFKQASNSGVVYVGTHGRGLWESTTLVGIEDVPGLTQRESHLTDLKVFPNPVQGEGLISFESSFNGNVNVRMYDINGRQVKEWQERVANGHNRITFNTMNMRSGSYFAVVESETQYQTSKFIVLH